jgi:hypothetical protein
MIAGMDAQTVGTWVLVVATVVLALATVVLAGATVVLARYAARQTSAIQAQGHQLEESLAVSREMLDAAKAERAAAAPLSVLVDLKAQGSGAAQIVIRNAGREAVMYVSHVEIRDGPNGPILVELALNDVPIDARGGGWQASVTWDPEPPGPLIEIRVTGHRQEGPTMTREFIFRVAEDGQIVNLGGPGRPRVL